MEICCKVIAFIQLLTYDLFFPLLLHYSYSLNTISKGLVNPLATHMYIIDIEVTLSTPQSDVTSKSALKVDLGGPVCCEDTKGPFPFSSYSKTVSILSRTVFVAYFSCLSLSLSHSAFAMFTF